MGGRAAGSASHQDEPDTSDLLGNWLPTAWRSPDAVCLRNSPPVPRWCIQVRGIWELPTWQRRCASSEPFLSKLFQYRIQPEPKRHPRRNKRLFSFIFQQPG